MAEEHAPGWWQASDGRWYPPELHPDATTVAPAPSLGAPPSLDKPSSSGFVAPGVGDPPSGPPPLSAYAPPAGSPAYGGPPPYAGAAPYGAPAPYGGYYAPPGPVGPRTSGLAVAAMVLGGGSLLVSLVPFLGWFSVPFALAGIGIGIAAIVQTGKGVVKGKGLGIGGVVTSILALLVSVLWIFVWNAASDEIQNYDYDQIDGGINSDPSDGYCDIDRYLQDPDC